MTRETALRFLKIRKFKAFLFDYTGTCLFAVGCLFGIFFFRLLHSFGDRGVRELIMFVIGQLDDEPLPITLVKSIRWFLIIYIGLSLMAVCLVKNKQRIFFVLYTGWFFFGCIHRVNFWVHFSLVIHMANFWVDFSPVVAFLSAFVVSIFLRKKKRFLLRMNTLMGTAVHLCGFLVLVFLFTVFFYCREGDIFVFPG